MAALNLQDQIMTDHKTTGSGKCRAWKITDQTSGLENVRPNHLYTSEHFRALWYGLSFSRYCIIQSCYLICYSQGPALSSPAIIWTTILWVLYFPELQFWSVIFQLMHFQLPPSSATWKQRELDTTRPDKQRHQDKRDYSCSTRAKRTFFCTYFNAPYSVNALYISP